METLIAGQFIAKYGSIVVLSDFSGESLFPLLLERLNIYTDPQRPMTVTEGIFEINNPDENSPVMVTTNFALTYFIVSGEIEASRVPAWLLIKDSEGLSVLTAWAAGKFSGDDVGMFVKKKRHHGQGQTYRVDHTRLRGRDRRRCGRRTARMDHHRGATRSSTLTRFSPREVNLPIALTIRQGWC
jgi:acetyl-CoA decarbonylase/synthase complex subunit gamma